MNGERRSVEEIRNSLYETRGRLDRDLEELDERLHRELSLKEIALVLELTDARVCQLSKQAIAKASRFLTDQA